MEVKSTDINIKHLKELNWATSGMFTMWVTVTTIWFWASLLVRRCSRVLLRHVLWVTPVFPSGEWGGVSQLCVVEHRLERIGNALHEHSTKCS